MTRRAAPKALTIVGLASVSEATIYPHVFENADREVGGVLIGRIARDGTLPMVTGAIPALKADEQRATLTFTQDTWEHVHRTLDHDFPEGEQIVGWYHSHPGFGIFLSGHDLFIHRNFFSGLSQVALVVDPVARTHGVFAWEDGEVEPLFERPTPPEWVATGATERPQQSARRAPAETASRRAYPLPPLVVAAVLGLGLGLVGWKAVTGSGETATSAPVPAAVQTVKRTPKTQPAPASGKAATGTSTQSPAATGGSATPTDDKGCPVGQENEQAGTINLEGAKYRWRRRPDGTCLTRALAQGGG